MPSKVRDSSLERRRESLKEDTFKTEKSERRDRTRTSHRKASAKDRTESRTSLSPSRTKRRSSMPGAASSDSKTVGSRGFDSKSSLPYPSFSKAHSKEAVGTREEVRPTLNIFTPPATDVSAPKERFTNLNTHSARHPPPSPPLTDQNAGQARGSTARPAEVETILEEERVKPQDHKIRFNLKPKSSKCDGRLRSNSELGDNASPGKPRINDRTSAPLKISDPNIPGPYRSTSQPSRSPSPAQLTTAFESATNTSSNATSIAPEQPNIQRPGSKIPPAAFQDDLQSSVTSIQGDSRNATPLEIFIEDDDRDQGSNMPGGFHPPPPPPPPDVPLSIPRVDYLLQNGGLGQNVPKSLLLAGKPIATRQASISPTQPPVVVANLFEPYNHLLDEFEKVICKNGSLAVATGYRSVARRLLDRLEAVFARDISSEACQCCMCTYQNQEDDFRGVNWGEILELVSGRRELPNWPPFSFVASSVGLGISLETHIPMQKLDVDVPEEYREHYIRQSRKTKQSVDKWLNRQTDSPSSPPEEVDDETLTFAILTHLSSEHRSVLTNLLGIVQGPTLPPRRAPTPDRNAPPQPTPTPQPQPRIRPEAIATASLAIQRLYRVGQPPRDAETALFMLNNPTLHNALATLAAVSSDEWDILISGRFDGFLRSGADDVVELSERRYTPFKATSRGPTPLRANGQTRQSGRPLRPETPAISGQYGAPIAFDEETEIATLAEVEREIYTGMEALEDAFEILHLKAENVRKALRDRSAGLAAAAQRRRGSVNGVEVRGGTPASGMIGHSLHGTDRWDTETDDGLGDWDGVSDLAPDDSASNISSSRRRRPKRRNERRTPNPVLEEDESESYAESEGAASPKRRDVRGVRGVK